jgi:acyl-CoA thioesterase-2
VRRVTAIQHGQPIFFLAASFQVEEGRRRAPALDARSAEAETSHPRRPAPEQLARLPTKVQRWLSRQGTVRVPPRVSARRTQPAEAPALPARLVPLSERVGDAPELHRALLAYASDFHLLGTATFPHGISYYQPNVLMASLDHALWFHRPFRADEWLLYSIDSPSAQDGRGLARGQVFDRNGKLVASTAQEGLIRVVQAQATQDARAKAKA